MNELGNIHVPMYNNNIMQHNLNMRRVEIDGNQGIQQIQMNMSQPLQISNSNANEQMLYTGIPTHFNFDNRFL